MSEPSSYFALTSSRFDHNAVQSEPDIEVKKTGVDGCVLLAHGSRDKAWQEPIERIAQAMQAKNHHAVCAYLEHSAPNLDQVLWELQAQGLSKVRLVPLFLGVGRHVRSDLPSLLEQAQKKYPDLCLSMTGVLGDSAAFTEAVAHLISDL